MFFYQPSTGNNIFLDFCGAESQPGGLSTDLTLILSKNPPTVITFKAQAQKL
jgi:hypothetical protein